MFTLLAYGGVAVVYPQAVHVEFIDGEFEVLFPDGKPFSTERRSPVCQLSLDLVEYAHTFATTRLLSGVMTNASEQFYERYGKCDSL